MFIPMENRVAVGLHHARRAEKSQHHRDRFCDLVEGAEYPHLVLAEIIRRLGRQRSLAVEIDPKVVNAAIKVPKIFEGRM